MKVTYGYDVQEGDDPMLTFIESVMEKYSHYLAPGAFLVDAIPILRYVPSWMPGAGFKKLARTWKEELLKTINAPHDFAKKRMASMVFLALTIQY